MAEKKSSTPQILSDIIPLMDEKKLFTVLPYIPKLSNKLKKTLKKYKINVTYKRSNIYRAFSTVARIKPDPFWVVVFIEFLVLVAVLILEEPNSN